MVRTLIDAIGLGLSIFIGAIACGALGMSQLIVGHPRQENALRLVFGAVLGAIAGGVLWKLMRIGASAKVRAD